MHGLNINYDDLILQALRGPGGFTTGQVAGMCTPYLGSSKAEHTRFIRTRLLALQEAGQVRPMDSLKPVCWVRVSPSSQPAQVQAA